MSSEPHAVFGFLLNAFARCRIMCVYIPGLPAIRWQVFVRKSDESQTAAINIDLSSQC